MTTNNMQKHLTHIPTIAATTTGRHDVMGDTYAVAWPSSESCIGLPSDQPHTDLAGFAGVDNNEYKQSYNPNRM